MPLLSPGLTGAAGLGSTAWMEQGKLTGRGIRPANSDIRTI